MHAVALVDDLKVFLADITSKMVFPVHPNQQGQAQTDRAPLVLDWWPPPGKTQQRGQLPDAIHPYLVVMFDQGDTSQEMAVVKVDIIANLYGENTACWRDPINLLENIRIALKKKYILNGKYQLQPNMKMKLPNQQDWPYWQGWLETSWIIGLPQEELGEVYGDGLSGLYRY